MVHGRGGGNTSHPILIAAKLVLFLEPTYHKGNKDRRKHRRFDLIGFAEVMKGYTDETTVFLLLAYTHNFNIVTYGSLTRTG